MMLTIRKLIILIGGVCFLQGCAETGMGDLREFVATAYQNEKPEIEPLPEIQPYSGYEYSATEDDDPFAFSNIETSQQSAAVVDSGLRPDANRRKEDLEQFPLDALKMVGTMTQEGRSWVIVKTSEGTAHRAALGNYMGQQDGKIIDIIPEEQKVVLAELVQDPAGRWITRNVEITIDE
ncbi:MAG: pilus assembly protein PilP [Acidiferrobacterales bacterium]|nr:pilus assembly protein PilP [Acidiferrobacterales bacterium]